MGTKKKYRLTDESITYKWHKFYRIEAIKNFNGIKAGTKGGFVESERNPFDRVLVRDNNDETWSCNFFSHIREVVVYKFTTITSSYKQCIPYNDDTKHLVGTTDEAPEFYRHWDD